MGSKAGKALVAKCEALQAEFSGFEDALVKRAKAGKSKFKSCAHCESKISLKHLGGFGGLSKHDGWFRPSACPVCRHDLLQTPTDKKRLEALRLRLKKTEQLLQEKIKANPTKAYWLIGGWVAS